MGMLTSSLPLREEIRVSVEVVYAPQHSRPGQEIFIYFITIENYSDETIQLLKREWFIFEGDTHVGYINEEGVVGEKPVLEPRQIYHYDSFCPITHPPGSMHGFYTFQTMRGELFRVRIPRFELELPSSELN